MNTTPNKEKEEPTIDLDKLRELYNLLKQIGVWDEIKRKVYAD